MSKSIEIGMLCGKGDGHSSFDGHPDYGVCGSDQVGTFTLSLNAESGPFDESELLNDAAGYIAEAIKFYEKACEKRMWDEYEANKVE